MKLQCTGQLKIECSKCSNIVIIDCSDLPFDVVETQETKTGTQKTHSVDYEINCPKCDQEITVKYEIWELPEGIINDKNIDIKGGKLIQECDCSMEE